MDVIGIICEYNPFHNGHVYHLNTIRKMYPDCLIVLALGGNFLERGDVSLISKLNKTRLALEYGVDVVMELPTLYNTNSADIFAYEGVSILNDLGVSRIVFGSECGDLEYLKRLANESLSEDFSSVVRENLKQGLNYPTSLSRALDAPLKSNDILGVAYIKAINEINPKIEPIVIKRTNDYDDDSLDSDIVSASNVRLRIQNGEDISKYIPNYSVDMINKIDYDKLFMLLKYKIITESHLERFLGVDEGLENRIKKVINEVHSFNELVELTKSKRYTTSRIKRMYIHILLGIEKSDIKLVRDIHRVLGFSDKGQKYIKNNEHVSSKVNDPISIIETRASLIYYDLTNDKSALDEGLNKPIK